MKNFMHPIYHKALRWIASGFVFMILIFASGCSHKTDAYDYQGKPIKLSAYHGKWVIINYWATWCKPCLTELPELNALYASSKNKVMVIGVSYDQLPNNELQQFAEKYSLHFPLVQHLPLQRYGVDHIASIPATYIIAPNGRLSKTLFGPQTSDSLHRAMSASNDTGVDKYLPPKRPGVPD